MNLDEREMEEPGSLTDEVLDRLVDGELEASEYAQVVRSLDQLPDGWKRCGLAFLEAQAWRTELEPRPSSPPVVRLPAASGQQAAVVFTGWTRLVTLAATGLLMFALGQISGRAGRPVESDAVHVPGSVPVIVSTEPPTESATGDRPAEDRREPLRPAGSKAPGGADLPLTLVGNPAPWGSLQLQVDDAVGWQGEQVEIPVYELAEGGAERLLSEQSAFTPEMIQQIERSGNRIHRRHGVMPVPLSDGNQVLVPYEQVEIVPIGGPMFQ